MEGPTPVSALLHAATMVAAGVYLVVRADPLFAQAHWVQGGMLWVGTVTAAFAALLGLVQSDIKRVLAYSTCSQLGFMVAALGAGSAFAGYFHLGTHAFFKALLFLGAGSVIHAVHSNELKDMGGLARRMPLTAVTFALGRSRWRASRRWPGSRRRTPSSPPWRGGQGGSPGRSSSPPPS
jgi:NADH-quinone oxidoreductase subunit L